ncbi:MAG: ModD protein [Coriobacteriales bacterium]
MYIPDSYLEQIIHDDVPSVDLTTCILDIGNEPGRIEYFSRDDAVICGTEEAARIYKMLGCGVEDFLPSGTRIEAGQSFMHATGPASGLHMGWKCCLNIFEYYSALATKAADMVARAHKGNPTCEVLTTRKSMPGTKLLDTKAILVGGAFPHRLGLSETVLVFDHHLTFYGGMDKFVADVPQIKHKLCEKKLFVEAGVEDAPRLVEAGVDGIQLDKVPVDEVAALAEKLRAINPNVTLIAAGGINLKNAEAYAATGVDGLATTCLHFAKPLDMSVRMQRR